MRFALGLRVIPLSRVVTRFREGLAKDRGDAETRRRRHLLVAVDALRVLAQRALHADVLGEDHVEDRVAPGLHTDRLPADRIARTGLDHDAGDAARQRVVEAGFKRVDAVDGAEPRAVRVGHFIGVVACPALAVLVHAEVRMGVEEAGQHPGPRRIDQFGVLGDVDVGLRADRGACGRPARNTRRWGRRSPPQSPSP